MLLALVSAKDIDFVLGSGNLRERIFADWRTETIYQLW